MKEIIAKLIKGKVIMILGFAREGRSTYDFIRKYFPEKQLIIADRNLDDELVQKIKSTDKFAAFNLGEDYLNNIHNVDIIFKSPGVNLNKIKINQNTHITTQTQLFLSKYSHQTIGITGTKGKSTTASLLHHILIQSKRDSILLGNIGVAPFSMIEYIKEDTKIVFELSAHQLEDVSVSPHIGVLLNVFEEHLDHFDDYSKYNSAKNNIFDFQHKNNIRIVNLNQSDRLKNSEKKIKSRLIGFSSENDINAKCFLDNGFINLISEKGEKLSLIKATEIKSLIGKHNLSNIMAAILCCKEVGLLNNQIIAGINSFKSLEHRLEYVGYYKNIHFYNDSIATIPEATIAAIKAIPNINTLILGGFERGLNYQDLVDFVSNTKIENIILMGKTGERMLALFNKINPSNKNLIFAANLKSAMKTVVKFTSPQKACILSPAAASFDQFVNFEERGRCFKKIARNL